MEKELIYVYVLNYETNEILRIITDDEELEQYDCCYDDLLFQKYHLKESEISYMVSDKPLKIKNIDE